MAIGENSLLAQNNPDTLKNTYDTLRIPPGYNPQKHILLVAQMPKLNNPAKADRSVTHLLNTLMLKNYPYKYEIVPLPEILNGNDTSKYRDTSVYRFALLNNLSSITHTTTTTVQRGSNQWSVSPSARITYIDFSFFDRVAQKQYEETGYSSSNLKNVVVGLSEMVKAAKGN